MAIQIVTNNIKGGISAKMKEVVNVNFKKLTKDARVAITKETNSSFKVSICFVDKFNHHYRLSVSDTDVYSAIHKLSKLTKKELNNYKNRVTNLKINSHNTLDYEVT